MLHNKSSILPILLFLLLVLIGMLCNPFSSGDTRESYCAACGGRIQTAQVNADPEYAAQLAWVL